MAHALCTLTLVKVLQSVEYMCTNTYVHGLCTMYCVFSFTPCSS